MAAARVNSKLDLENLAEEVESLGRSDLATVRSELRRIIEHLLKLEYSPTTEPRFGWRESIIEARDVVADVVTATLAREAEAGLAMTYQQGRRRADVALRRHGEGRGCRHVAFGLLTALVAQALVRVEAAFDAALGDQKIQMRDGLGDREAELVAVERAIEQLGHDLDRGRRPAARLQGRRQALAVVRDQLIDPGMQTAKRRAVRGQHQAIVRQLP
jgi:hypothetical protein